MKIKTVLISRTEIEAAFDLVKSKTSELYKTEKPGHRWTMPVWDEDDVEGGTLIEVRGSGDVRLAAKERETMVLYQTVQSLAMPHGVSKVAVNNFFSRAGFGMQTWVEQIGKAFSHADKVDAIGVLLSDMSARDSVKFDYIENPFNRVSPSEAFISATETDASFLEALGAALGKYDAQKGGFPAKLESNAIKRLAEFEADFPVTFPSQEAPQPPSAPPARTEEPDQSVDPSSPQPF